MGEDKNNYPSLLRGLQYAAVRRIVCREDRLWQSCLRCLPAGGRRTGLGSIVEVNDRI
jgi:hypothetical protein